MAIHNSSPLHPEGRSRANWERVLTKVKKFSNGMSVPGAVVMRDIHLLECEEIKLKIADKELSIRLHPTKSFSYELLHNYKKISRESISFNHFLQHKIDKWHEKGNIGKIDSLISGLKSVDYLSEDILASLIVSFGTSGEIIMPDSLLALWTDKVLTAKRNRECPDDKLTAPTFREFCEEMRETIIEPISLPATEYIFILTTDRKLKIVYKALNLFHSSLSHGGAVLAAGKCHLKLNKIIRIEAYSGHYHPGLFELINFLEYLEDQGIDTSEIDFLIHEKNFAQNDKIWKGRDLKVEITTRKELLLEELRKISLGAYNLALDSNWNHAKLLDYSSKAKSVHLQKL